jgi:UDP-3-O-[3-hydroxymyristoyl] N-acetylglucosamine deacetylase
MIVRTGKNQTIAMHQALFMDGTKQRSVRALPRQMTLMSPVSFYGEGVHSGSSARVTVYPSEVDEGYVFQRTDIKSGPIFGRYNNVVNTHMCTVIGNDDGVQIGTVEHLLASLSGLGITNAYIEVSGPEIPIMDGSALEFSKTFQEIGVKRQRASCEVLFVKKQFIFKTKTGKITVLPSNKPEIIVQFDGYNRMDSLLENRNAKFCPQSDCFLSVLSNARTFGFYEDGVALKERGYAKGASLSNTIIIQKDQILNQEGLRSSDEFVRHKLLDLIGDISLSGVQIFGTIIGHNTGHTLNNQFLHAFMHAYDYWD